MIIDDYINQLMIIDQCSAETDSLFPRLIIFIGK